MLKIALKIFLFLSLIAVLIFVGISSGVINISKIENANNPSQKLYLSKIEDIGYLKLIACNVNYIVADTILSDTSGFYKFHSNNKSLAIITGEVNANINLKGINKINIKEGKDTVYIFLPLPFLGNPKINYIQSKIFDNNFDSKALNQNFVNKYFPNAENDLKAEAIRMGILDKAKENAVKILHPLIKEIVKKEVVLEFEEEQIN
jgi:Protein of unknown function (DUF4230)